MRNMKRALIVLSAALVMSAVGVADSHAGGATKASKATKTAKTAVKGLTMRTAAAKGPGMCGTYMYWKGGKCLDAREKT